MVDPANEPRETYRKAELRLRVLLLGDVDTVGRLKGEDSRAQAAAELRRMRRAFDALVLKNEEAGGAEVEQVLELEEELRKIASFVSRAEPRTESAPRLLTPAEAAEALNMSLSTIYRAVRNGEIRAVRITKRRALRIPASEIHHLLEGTENARAAGERPNL